MPPDFARLGVGGRGMVDGRSLGRVGGQNAFDAARLGPFSRRDCAGYAPILGVGGRGRCFSSLGVGGWDYLVLGAKRVTSLFV